MHNSIAIIYGLWQKLLVFLRIIIEKVMVGLPTSNPTFRHSSNMNFGIFASPKNSNLRNI